MRNNAFNLSSIAAVSVICVSTFSAAGDQKPACCEGTETVALRENPTRDGDNHEGHHHGGGVYDVVKKDGNLNTLAAMLGQAELEELLSHDQWTIFAPTDDAFAKLPPDTLDILLKPENVAKLKQVLLAHVVKGTVPSSGISSDATKVRTEAGGELAIAKSADGAITVNGARLTKADEPATNGIVHQIDAVILPKGVID